MCGIAGQVRHGGGSVDADLIERMCVALEHRGPDSRGIHASGEVGLGIQRLRIIDLATGDQPIYNEDRSVVVVLNGEIYNFRELRSELEAKGHRFATHSDTEVIVHLYEDHGVDCVRRLHGMFAFALWDERRKQLLIARDRVGKKPLFYAARNGTFTFASEMRSLLQDPGIPRTLDHQALDCYLAYQYVPAPLTAFRTVRKLPPASTLVLREGQISINRYWRLDYSRKRPTADMREVHEELRERLREAVRRRMVADVPLGAFLSGGVDSSAVVAAMAEASPKPIKTFSIGFENESFNELPAARRIAELFSTEHHEFTVKPDAVEMIPKIVRHYGEPFADSSAIPSFYVSELTGQHVTVALNGDGGDESFGGYNRYAGNLIAHRLERLPLPLRRALAGVADTLPSTGDMSSNLNRGRRLARSLVLDPPARYARQMSFFDDSAREELYTPDYRELIGESLAPEVIAAPWREASGSASIDVMLEVDVETYLPGDLLVKMDIATMAYSLEARSPFLDPAMMEFAASLPGQLKLDGLNKKVVLRDALRGWVPDEILDRPKMGFGVPIVDWFRGELRGYVEDVLLDPQARSRGYFREKAVRRLIGRHVSGREDLSYRIWALLMHELWHREFVDSNAASEITAAAA
jgi:asparagine synthase (glutamine-hydrolysing)